MNDWNHIALSSDDVELSTASVVMVGALCCERRSSFEELVMDFS